MKRPYAMHKFHTEQRKETREQRVELARIQAELDVLFGDGDACPDFATHTPAPRDVLMWNEWRDEMLKTCKPIKCKTCGLDAIWVPRKPRKRK